MDLERLQPLTQEWLDQRFQNYFECDPNLSLVNNKGVRKGGWGYPPPLELIFYKNCITC